MARGIHRITTAIKPRVNTIMLEPNGEGSDALSLLQIQLPEDESPHDVPAISAMILSKVCDDKAMLWIALLCTAPYRKICPIM